MTLVLATVIGLAGGYYLDRWLGTSPWLVTDRPRTRYRRRIRELLSIGQASGAERRMTSSDLTTRVTRRTAAAVAVLALGGGWLGGAPGAAGVLAGGALALGSFRWLAARVVAVCRGLVDVVARGSR